MVLCCFYCNIIVCIPVALITKTGLLKYIENQTKVSDKNFDIFHVSGKAVLMSTHNLCFWAEIRKLMYTPLNPSFTI